MALTDTQIRSFKPKKGEADILVADGNGLYIRCHANNDSVSRSWQFRRKKNGRVDTQTLGTYPQLSLKDARLKAAELATKRAIYSPTVREAADQWLKERVDHTHRQAEQVRGYVDRAIIPDLGHKRVRDVDPSDIADMVRRYRDRVGRKKKARTGGRAAARALLAVAKGLFGYAVAHGWIERSPAAQLTQAIIGASQAARDRVLSDDEIRFAMTTQASAGPVIRFLLATGLRLGEAYTGRRAGDHWVVPSAASKNKREHRVWLSPVALAQLDHHPWEAARETVQHWLKVNAGGAIKGWTAHDVRRTFATRCNEMGVAPYIVEKMLNHSFDGVMAVYNRASYDDERRKALEMWSAWLTSLVEQRPAEVVPMRVRRK